MRDREERVAVDAGHGKAAGDIGDPIDVLGFSPSQARKAAPGVLLNYMIKHGIETTH